ncbi:MAG: response regulator transcription factor [Thermodesulfobacteriota bacterium]
MSIRVVVAFSNNLFAEGMCKLLGDMKDVKVVDVLKSGKSYPSQKLESLTPDVIIVDFIALYNAFADVDTTKMKGFLLLDTDCGRDNIVSAILTKRVSGVLMGHATPSHLKDAVRAVARGEVWMDRTVVKNILYGVNALNRERAEVLSEREKEITALIGQGYRNKEIAQKLCICESTVKAHLHRIFQKLGIKNRTQLITFFMKNQEVTNFFSSRTNQ